MNSDATKTPKLRSILLVLAVFVPAHIVVGSPAAIAGSCDQQCARSDQLGLCRAACLADGGGDVSRADHGVDLQALQIIASTQNSTLVSSTTTEGDLVFLNIPYGLQAQEFRTELRNHLSSLGTRPETEQSLLETIGRLLRDQVARSALQNGEPVSIWCDGSDCLGEGNFGVRN